MLKPCLVSLVVLGTLTACSSPVANTANVGVASNFTAPAREIAALFEEATGGHILLSFGSTGQLFTQITQQAPFDVFLAADEEAPRRAVAAGLADPASLFTYAIGEIVLYSPTLDLTNGEAILREASFERIALANPVTSPYGAAALEAIESLGLSRQLRGKFVLGNNIAQTFQFVETGNAELGFIARAQVQGIGPPSIWNVPENLYPPIRQAAVLLGTGRGNPAAAEFLAFLRSPEATNIIERFGYRTSE